MSREVASFDSRLFEERAGLKTGRYKLGAIAQAIATLREPTVPTGTERAQPGLAVLGTPGWRREELLRLSYDVTLTPLNSVRFSSRRNLWIVLHWERAASEDRPFKEFGRRESRASRRFAPGQAALTCLP